MLPDPDGDYDEAGFLNELCKRTGCGLVLDVYNLECDAHNHGLDIDRFLGVLQLGAVHELHVAGGTEAMERGLLCALAARAALDRGSRRTSSGRGTGGVGGYL